MRCALSLALAMALLPFAPQTSSAPKKAKSRPPVELKISGTGFFRYGDALKFKAVLTNRSSEPIVIGPDYDVVWKIMDSAGRELKQDGSMICPITGIEEGARFPLKDDDVHFLMPGEKIETEDNDIGLCYSFAGRGTYQVVATFVFEAPEFTESGDAIVRPMMFDRRVLLDVKSLSPARLDALRHASAFKASSNRWTMQMVK